MLYGLCHAAIVSLGYSPGLGFVHTGKQLSFVYDIADLYKVETTIPAAFAAVKSAPKPTDDLSKAVRVNCRDYFANTKLLSRIPRDIAWLLQDAEVEHRDNAISAGALWDAGEGTVEGGVNYGFEVQDR